MGECAYYINEKEAKKAGELLDAFFSEASQAYEFYQGINLENKSSRNFWEKFEKQFPQVYDYVAFVSENFKSEEPRKVLHGKLDFGQDENNETLVNGNIVAWGDSNVWHMADWSPLCKYVEHKFGAVKTVWDNEENGCGSLDSLQLYDYESIVENLMKHEELFPLLVGVHDELDSMLDIRMRHSKKGTK